MSAITLVEAEVIDIRTLNPLDDETMIESVTRTGRAMVRRLPPTQRDAVLALERDAGRRTAGTGGSIDLF